MTDRLERWRQVEREAQICGWDFSPIAGKFHEDDRFPWDYGNMICRYVRPTDRILDMDTGGGEKLLSLGHDPALTAAVEGYAPNIALCQERLLPLGIDFRPCSDVSAMPFEDASFDVVLNRHGSYDFAEVRRVLKPGGIFLTQQVGAHNDRELVELVLPDVPENFSDHTLNGQVGKCRESGMEILYAAEAFRHMDFYDLEAFIWFAKIIPWEFTDFSVDGCAEALYRADEIIRKDGRIRGTTHRFCIAARRVEL
ncbi:MAG: class I SAM-dependent methyltransferase [Clostridia bacterium]|nr:class I SAM-dependent methyltransferase [Clostridia bacterium]